MHEYTTVRLSSTPDVRDVVRAAFPDYRKREAIVCTFYAGLRINSYWSGGTRNEFAVVELATLRCHNLPTATNPLYDVALRGLANKADGFVKIDEAGNITLKTLPDGFVVVRAGDFCGKRATAYVFVPAANMPRFLTS